MWSFSGRWSEWGVQSVFYLVERGRDGGMGHSSVGFFWRVESSVIFLSVVFGGDGFSECFSGVGVNFCVLRVIAGSGFPCVLLFVMFFIFTTFIFTTSFLPFPTPPSHHSHSRFSSACMFQAAADVEFVNARRSYRAMQMLVAPCDEVSKAVRGCGWVGGWVSGWVCGGDFFFVD